MAPHIPNLGKEELNQVLSMKLTLSPFLHTVKEHKLESFGL